MSSQGEALKIQKKQAELLCFGYLRDKSSQHLILSKDIVSTLCIRYFLQRVAIDYFKGYKAAEIDKKQNTFAVTKGSTVVQFAYAVAQCGWSSGCHEMSIEVMNHDFQRNWLSIGIVTNPHMDFDSWLQDKEGVGVSYYFGIQNDSNPSGIYERHKGETNRVDEMNKETHHVDQNEMSIQKGARIGIEVNCDEGTIRFLYNQNQIGQTVNIPYHIASCPLGEGKLVDRCYYPAILYSTPESCAYKLITHTRHIKDH